MAPHRQHRVIGVAIAIPITLALVTFAFMQSNHMLANRKYDPAPVCRVVTEKPVIALTFDDGPTPDFTPRVLDLLAQNQSKATFFMIGVLVKDTPEIVDAVTRADNEIAGHSWSHPDLTTIDIHSVSEEVTRGRDALTPHNNVALLFRAPFGYMRPEQLAEVQKSGLTAVHWSLAVDHVVAQDRIAAEALGRRLVEQVRPGDILLAHDAEGAWRGVALDALAYAVPELRRRGYAITTVSDLLREGAAVEANARPWFWQSGFTCPA